MLSGVGDLFISGGLPKMATYSESKQFTVYIETAVYRTVRTLRCERTGVSHPLLLDTFA